MPTIPDPNDAKGVKDSTKKNKKNTKEPEEPHSSFLKVDRSLRPVGFHLCSETHSSK